MTTAVLDALLDWLTEHHAGGANYSARAVQAAGEAAVAAEAAGLAPDECVEAGRAAFFDRIIAEQTESEVV